MMARARDLAVESSDALPRFALSESPWYWLVLFSTMGLSLLLAIDTKYSKRQARLEIRYMARQQTNQRNDGVLAARNVSEERAITGHLPNRLLPLRISLVLLLWGAIVALWWERHKSHSREE